MTSIVKLRAVLLFAFFCLGLLVYSAVEFRSLLGKRWYADTVYWGLRLSAPSSSPTIFESIAEARNKVLAANRELSRLRAGIPSNVSQAKAQDTLNSALKYLDAIEDSVLLIAEKEDTLERDILGVVDLYNQEILELAARRQEKGSILDVTIWIGIIGMVATVSAMVLGWRKDAREVAELRRKLELSGN